MLRCLFALDTDREEGRYVEWPVWECGRLQRSHRPQDQRYLRRLGHCLSTFILKYFVHHLVVPFRDKPVAWTTVIGITEHAQLLNQDASLPTYHQSHSILLTMHIDIPT